MIDKMNLKEQADAVRELFEYRRVGTLNEENTGGTYHPDNG